MALSESNSPTSPTIEEYQTPIERKQPTEVVVRELVETLLLTFFIFFLVNGLVGRYRIDGSSMNPTLSDGQYLLVSNFSYYLNDPEQGEIIVFHHPTSDLNLIKRVIGLPGDHVVIENGTVTVNGEALTEPYISAPPQYRGQWTVPEGQYFVLGDNRNASSDSHTWSFLPAENIVGRAEIIYYPITDWGKVPHTHQ